MESALSLFRRRRDEIFDALRLYSAILNMCPDFIGEEDVLSLAGTLDEMSPAEKNIGTGVRRLRHDLGGRRTCT